MFIFRQAGCVCSLVYKEVPDESCTFFTHKNEGTEDEKMRTDNAQKYDILFVIMNYR
jgi:hypothetical protein